MNLFNVLVGLTLLTFGRKLFWLFVGGIGFVAGFTSAHQIWGLQSELLIFGIALASGCVGALIAIFFQGLAIALAGFAAGGYISMIAMALFGFETDPAPWPAYVIGGIFGAVLLFLIFDWALIFLSSLSGASLIVQSTDFSSFAEMILFFILVIFGVVLQTAFLKREQRSETSLRND